MGGLRGAVAGVPAEQGRRPPLTQTLASGEERSGTARAVTTRAIHGHPAARVRSPKGVRSEATARGWIVLYYLSTPGWQASFHDHSRWRIIDEEEEDIIGTEGEVGADTTDALAASLEQQHSSVIRQEWF